MSLHSFGSVIPTSIGEQIVFDWKDRIDIRMHGILEAKLRTHAEETVAAGRIRLLEQEQVEVKEV